MAHASALPHSPFMEDDGLRDLPITPLVVGDSRALVLGRRVVLGRAASSTAVPGTDAAAWRAAFQGAARWPWQWQVLLAAALATLVAGVVLAGTVLQSTPGQSVGLPVYPATFSAPVVRMVATAYVAAPRPASADMPIESVAVPPSEADAATPPLSPPATIAAPAPVATRSALAPRRSPSPRSRERVLSGAKAQTPEQRQPEQDDLARRAVVLDEPGTRAESGVVAEAAPPARPLIAVTLSAGLARAPASKDGDKPPAAPGGGLIAITPDSRLAVFTDPRTRLPQQFHVGDPLPGGDTIRAIDGSLGKVFTSGREYSLD
jgi:hypothetical protein